MVALMFRIWKNWWTPGPKQLLLKFLLYLQSLMNFVLLFILICPASAIWLEVKQILNHQTVSLLNCTAIHSIAIEVWFTALRCTPIEMCRPNPVSSSREVSTSAIVNITDWDGYIHKEKKRNWRVEIYF